MKALLILLSIFSFSLVYGQGYELPNNIELEKAEDYAKYEKDVVQAMTWLMETPLGEESDKRRDLYAFVLKWATGTPTVTLELHADIMDFECSDCLMIFMGSWCKYAIETGDTKDLVNGNMAGVKAVIEFYQKNQKQLGKNKLIKKFKKLQSKGKLKAYVEKTIAG